jgi:hypothetical protein
MICPQLESHQRRLIVHLVGLSLRIVPLPLFRLCFTLAVQIRYSFAYRSAKYTDAIKFLVLWHATKHITDSNRYFCFEYFLLLFRCSHRSLIVSKTHQ